jgi:hypothetical protein
VVAGPLATHGKKVLPVVIRIAVHKVLASGAVVEPEDRAAQTMANAARHKAISREVAVREVPMEGIDQTTTDSRLQEIVGAELPNLTP